MSDPRDDIKAPSDRFISLASEEDSLREKWREHWLLSLSIANGGAILLILDHVAKQEWSDVDMFLPSLSFFIGLACTGAGRLAHSKLHDRRSQRYRAYLCVRELVRKMGGDTTLLDQADPPLERKVKWWSGVADVTEGASALLFLVGCGFALYNGYAHLRPQAPTAASCTAPPPRLPGTGTQAPPARQPAP